MAKNVRRIKKREDVESVAVQEAVSVYLQAPHVRKLDSETQREYRAELTDFSAWCTSHALIQDKKTKTWAVVESTDELISLDKVNDHVIHAYLEHLKATHKPHKKSNAEISSYTLAGYVRVIKVFLNWCLLDGQYSQHIKAIVIQRIEKPAVIEKVIEAFSSEHIEALFEACQREESEHIQMRDRAILSLLLDTGIRAEELVTLTIGHVYLDVNDPHIRVFGKRNKWREVGMGEQARRSVQKYIRMFREPTIEYVLQNEHRNLTERQLKQLIKQELQISLLFVNRSGNKMTTSGLYQLVERLGESAHIEGVRCSPHTFRHTFATNFMRTHNDIYRLSKLLGHSSVKTTEGYLKSFKQSEARQGVSSTLDNL